MEGLAEIEEQSTGTISITFRNELGVPVTPVSASYSITDAFSGTTVHYKDEITPLGSSHDLTITSEDNTLVNVNYPYEIRLVSFVYEYQVGKFKTEEFEYKLLNLMGVPLVEEPP